MQNCKLQNETHNIGTTMTIVKLWLQVYNLQFAYNSVTCLR